MSTKALVILGVLLLVVGGVWIFQGTGYLGGSFMTGEPQWTWIGAATGAVGLGFLLWAGLRRA